MGLPDTSPTPSNDDVDAVPSQAALAARGIASTPARRIRALRSAPGALAHLDQVPILRSLPGAHTISQLVRGDLSGQAARRTPNTFQRKAFAGALGGVRHGPVERRQGNQERAGITVNDVVIALCAGALRRRLTATGESAGNPTCRLHPRVDHGCPTRRDRYGNAITSIIAPIPTHLAVGPRATRVRTRDIQARQAALARGAADADERRQRANPVADIRHRRPRPDGVGLVAVRAPTGESDHLERAWVARQVDLPRRPAPGATTR